MVIITDNMLLGNAIRELKAQYINLHPDYDGNFGWNHFDSPEFMVIKEGDEIDNDNLGKLTLQAYDDQGHVIKNENGRPLPDPTITPVDYENLVKEGEPLADTVERLLKDPAYQAKYEHLPHE